MDIVFVYCVVNDYYYYDMAANYVIITNLKVENSDIADQIIIIELYLRLNKIKCYKPIINHYTLANDASIN